MRADMKFSNEMVDEADIEKFELRKSNKDFLIGDFEYNWTINTNRDIYLRYMKVDREEPYRTHMVFYWKGLLLKIDLLMSGKGVRHGDIETTWKWFGLHQPAAESNKILIANRAEIMGNLKDALTAFKDGGMYSTPGQHTTKFEW